MLDLCTGTGDLALAYARRTCCPIVAADFCPEMLAIGRQKASKQGVANRITFVEADAQRLPFGDDQFQLVAIAFGLRNIADTDQGLREMVRVCRPGGRVAILSANDPVSFTCVFGISRAGGVWCPINPRNEAAENQELLELFDTEVLLYQRAFSPLVAAIRDRLPAIHTWVCLDADDPDGIDDGSLSLRDFLDRGAGTDVPARLYGLRERGRLQEGWHADVVVIDPETIDTEPVRMRFDLPTGAPRLYGNAVGIDHVLVNGTEIVDHGEFTDARPGTVLRSGRDSETVSVPGGAGA